MHAALRAYAGGAWTGAAKEAADWPDLDRLPGLRPPTLLLSGTADLPDFRLIADFIAGAAPQVQRIDVHDAGHLLHLERPREANAAIVEFLR